MFTDLLESEGYSVHIAGTAEDALGFLNRSIPNLILCDYTLPDHDGDWLCDTLQSDARYRAIPFVIMSAHTEAIIGRRSNYAEFLAKPFEVETLIDLVARLVKRPYPVPSASE